MKLPYTKSGKMGNMVWQRNRYGRICYPAFIPANPRTPAQVAIRNIFATVSQRWRTLTEEQRLAWIAVAATILSRPRLGHCGPLTSPAFPGRAPSCQFCSPEPAGPRFAICHRPVSGG